ncbi:MAG: cellulase family glycosylhydrolase [Anaerolineae bacterium]|nr:cellulase family glycosylhydrolase [Anaerolineae bacterium]
MRNILSLLIVLLLLAACRANQEPSPTAVPTQPALVQITSAPTIVLTATAVPPTPTPTPTATSKPTTLPTATFTPMPAYPLYAGPPLNRSDIGIQMHIQQVNLMPLMDHVQALDVGWVKTQVSWKLYQPYPDQYSADRLAELDAFVEAANARDIAVMLNVAKAPEWSRPTTELDGPPTEYAHFQQFMQFLAERYQGRVAAYELWNESNLKREWNGSPLNAADTVALMKAGADGVRAVDANAILISGAPATTGINDYVAAIDDRVYLRQMLDAGVGDFVDVIGVHPYGAGNPPESSASDAESSVPSHNNHPSFFFKDTLDEYAAILAEYGVEKELWATEFGWGSFDGLLNKEGTPVPPPKGVEYMSYLDEWQQAEYILAAYEMAHERDSVGPLILWNLNFGPILGTQFAESGYSVLRLDESVRPSYLALQHAAKQ